MYSSKYLKNTDTVSLWRTLVLVLSLMEREEPLTTHVVQQRSAEDTVEPVCHVPSRTGRVLFKETTGDAANKQTHISQGL